MASSNVPKPKSAEAAAILRSVYKDDQYKLLLKNQTNELFQRLFGIRRWMKLREELESLSDWTYYLVTTLAGLQTLGEEYVSIIETHGRESRVAPFGKRCLMSVLASFSPLAINWVICKIESILMDMNRTLWPLCLNNPMTRDKLTSLLPHLRHSITILHRIHLICFYFFGDFYEMSKRLTNVRYITLNSSHTFQSNRIYHLLGYLTLTQLVMSLIITFHSSFMITKSQSMINTRPKVMKDSEDEDDDDYVVVESQSKNEHENVKPNERCSLCLEPRVSSTATPCGHIFCWFCIAEWLQMKNECPICRESITHSRLIFLNNF